MNVDYLLRYGVFLYDRQEVLAGGDDLRIRLIRAGSKVFLVESLNGEHKIAKRLYSPHDY